jgi:hypothetical protein
MKIVLTEIEIALARLASDAITQYSESHNYDNTKKRDERSSNELFYQGFGAELAVAKVLNIYPDMSSDYSEYDLLWEGKTINVKSTKYPNGRLLIPEFQGRTADWYILVTGEMPEYIIRGVAHADEVFRKENIGDLGKGKSYIMEQNELMTMEDWLDA